MHFVRGLTYCKVKAVTSFEVGMEMKKHSSGLSPFTINKTLFLSEMLLEKRRLKFQNKKSCILLMYLYYCTTFFSGLLMFTFLSE